MRKARTNKIVLDRYGSYLGMEKGCFLVKHKDGESEKYPLFEDKIGEVVLKTGNTISIGALASLGFWEIDTLILTRRGKPVATLKSLEYDSHAKTRLCQYEAYNNDKATYIAKQIVLTRIRGQNKTLDKYNMKTDKNTIKRKQKIEKIQQINEKENTHTNKLENRQTEKHDKIKQTLIVIEGHCTKQYYKQLIKLFPEWLRPQQKRTHKAYEGLNNIFNLAYELLKWKVHIALIRAKLDPYLGFLHSLTYSMPSLVCDFQELYRHLVDDFLISYCQNLKKKDFTTKWEKFSRKRKGKREYLNNTQTRDLTEKLYTYLQTKIEIPRIKRGKQQKIETLISEEALLFAKYLRDEKKTWIPRITILI